MNELEQKPEMSVREMQAEVALLNKQEGWLACLSWLNRNELASVDTIYKAKDAMEGEIW